MNGRRGVSGRQQTVLRTAWSLSPQNRFEWFCAKADFSSWQCYGGHAIRSAVTAGLADLGHGPDAGLRCLWRWRGGFQGPCPLPDGPVAQLDRVADFYSAGCRFESCRDRQYRSVQRDQQVRGLLVADLELISRSMFGRCSILPSPARMKRPRGGKTDLSKDARPSAAF